MFEQLKMVWQARSLMKKNEAFLPTWHAYVGYKLDLFHHLNNGDTMAQITQREHYDAQLMDCWLDVGVAVGHLKTVGARVIPHQKMVKYFNAHSPYCIGELSKEMLEMHMPALISYPNLLKGEAKKPYYGDIYGQTVADTSALIEKRAFPLAYKMLTTNQATSVLDIGCGTGGYLLKIAKRHPEGKFTGIDMNASVIETAKANALKSGLTNVEFIHTSMEDWDESNNCFDAIMMNNILHYYSLEDRLKLMQRAKQLLNPEGILIIITPLYFEKGGERFTAFFNAFMNAHSNLYPLPRKLELLRDAKQLGLTFDRMKTIVREGSWYVVCLKNTH